MRALRDKDRLPWLRETAGTEPGKGFRYELPGRGAGEAIRDESAERLVLKPVLHRTHGTYVIVAFVVTVWVLAIVGHWGESTATELLGSLAVTLVFAAILGHQQLRMRIVLTDETVTIRDVTLSKQRVLRSAVASIHRHSYWIAFRDADGHVAMRARPLYSNGQLSLLSRELAVPFVDERQGKGIWGYLTA